MRALVNHGVQQILRDRSGAVFTRRRAESHFNGRLNRYQTDDQRAVDGYVKDQTDPDYDDRYADEKMHQYPAISPRWAFLEYGTRPVAQRIGNVVQQPDKQKQEDERAKRAHIAEDVRAPPGRGA
jgi:hypothetical protein